MDRSHEAETDIERARLRALVTGWSDEQLSRHMPAGWTVAAVLAHVGFWDARATLWLDKWAAGVEPVAPEYETEDDVDWINDAAKPLCLALPPRSGAAFSRRDRREAGCDKR